MVMTLGEISGLVHMGSMTPKKILFSVNAGLSIRGDTRYFYLSKMVFGTS